ncbi:lysine--tRNA ligase [Patescibacteria group bacterium]|nr:lysine--tRNA ligase [Patescibacteria group bacterium]
MENLETRMEEEHWADRIAKKLIEVNKNKKKFILASGITPSGKVHIGNFRDIITSDLVCRSLKEKGYEAQIIFSWDDYDRLRKIPSNVPESFSQYIGMPLCEIPDPYGCHKSYSEHFASELEEVLPSLGIDLRFIRQSQMYKANEYYPLIKKAIQERKKIAKILGEFRTQGISEEELESYFPLQVYCRSCKKSNGTKIVDYDGESIITYSCDCGHHKTVDISKENVGKLSWKVDWPMRWGFESVDFEPGGSDHSSPGGSFETASKIAKEVLDINPPYFQGYAFVGIQGASKMSSSKGTSFTPKDLLKIYEPELLRWVFSRARPNKSLTLFFDSDLIRQYEEFDKKISSYHENKLSLVERREIEFSSTILREIPKVRNVPFRQITSFGQIVQGNFQELKKMYERIGEEYDEETLKRRLEKSSNWVNEFMPELKIVLREKPNVEYYNSLSSEEKEHIRKLSKEMVNHWDLEKLTWLVYEIPKKIEFSDEEKKNSQRNFFKNVYHLLIDQDTGPRLPTFLIALGEEKSVKLLNFE